jgi:hypothetical protein
MLIAACDGGYHYRKLKVAGAEVYSEVPEKDSYSNPADALQYLLLGAGEGRNLVRGSERPKATNTVRHFNVLDRGATAKTRAQVLVRR